MEITIKKASVSDLEALIYWREKVLRDVFSIPAEENIDELLTANRTYYRSALEKGEHIAGFAYKGEQAVGCGGVCLYHEMPSPDNPSGRCGYLMNIFTAPEARKQGVGRTLAEWLVQEARRWGAEKIYLETTEQARPMYQKMGFCDMEGYLKLKI
ncbi:MAG: GNAT family N-acetyltransferase [Oscillospiraceae bacterium]|nr:GNAT family N-acetyltransferase [Oscillospiraceae bacterium]